MTEKKAVTNEDILENLLSFVQMFTERFDRLEARMDSLELRMGKVEKRLDSLEQTMVKLERRMDIVEHDITELKQTSYRQEQGLGRAIAVFECAHQKSVVTAQA